MLLFSMIESFKHKGLKRFFEQDDRSKTPSEMAEKIALVLMALENAETMDDLNRPSFRLHPLKGDLRGFWAVTIRANWRIIFRFENGKAFDVDLVEYH
jgi:proteic killer suppression protein